MAWWKKAIEKLGELIHESTPEAPPDPGPSATDRGSGPEVENAADMNAQFDAMRDAMDPDPRPEFEAYVRASLYRIEIDIRDLFKEIRALKEEGTSSRLTVRKMEGDFVLRELRPDDG